MGGSFPHAYPKVDETLAIHKTSWGTIPPKKAKKFSPLPPKMFAISNCLTRQCVHDYWGGGFGGKASTPPACSNYRHYLELTLLILIHGESACTT